MFDCPHGLGPLHLLVDIWWMFSLPVLFFFKNFFKKALDIVVEYWHRIFR
jgi:hypothetical protein